VLVGYLDRAVPLECKTSVQHLSILDAGKRQIIMHKTGKMTDHRVEVTEDRIVVIDREVKIDICEALQGT
jgi:hypothetical protein